MRGGFQCRDARVVPDGDEPGAIQASFFVDARVRGRIELVVGAAAHAEKEQVAGSQAVVIGIAGAALRAGPNLIE